MSVPLAKRTGLERIFAGAGRRVSRDFLLCRHCQNGVHLWTAKQKNICISITGLFDPISIDGTLVSRAYLHNLDIFDEFQFGIGDEISVYKANMIIPQIADNKTQSNTYMLPMTCPCCGKPLTVKYTSGGTRQLYCGIISPETYQQAISALKSRIRTVNNNTAGNRSQNLFVCGYCGRKLQRSHGKQVHLFCVRARFEHSPGCESLHENVDALQSNALQVVKLHAKLLLSKSDYIKNLDSSKREQIKSQIRIADMRLGHINSTKGFLYEEYRAGKYTKDRFKEIQQTNQMECERLQIQIKDLRKELEDWSKRYDAACNTTQSVKDILALSEYCPEVIARLVEQVRVFENGRVEIEFRNVDAFERLLLPESISHPMKHNAV